MIANVVFCIVRVMITVLCMNGDVVVFSAGGFVMLYVACSVLPGGLWVRFIVYSPCHLQAITVGEMLRKEEKIAEPIGKSPSFPQVPDFKAVHIPRDWIFHLERAPWPALLFRDCWAG